MPFPREYQASPAAIAKSGDWKTPRCMISRSVRGDFSFFFSEQTQETGNSKVNPKITCNEEIVNFSDMCPQTSMKHLYHGDQKSDSLMPLT